MKNVVWEIKGSILTITVDLNKKQGHSKSGKTIEGNQPVAPGVVMGLNIYTATK
jgi:hypothetical protein